MSSLSAPDDNDPDAGRAAASTAAPAGHER